MVNGVKYNNVMPPWAHLTDHELADVLREILGTYQPVRTL